MKHLKSHKKHKQKKPISRVRFRAPRGFFFKIQPSGVDYMVYLYRRFSRRTERIGYVELDKYYNGNIYRTHSNLDSKYWNKGLGALMYARAIKFALDRGYRVQSSGMSSPDAQRVWNGKGIRKYFRIVKQKVGYCGATWHAYPKLHP